jgi:hypothetical protein
MPGLCASAYRLSGTPVAARRRRCSDMADVAFIALTVAFFAALALVARKLDRS